MLYGCVTFSSMLLILLLFLIAPGRHHRASDWRGTCFAHRGLHDDTVPENSLAAFDRACESGFGIELDVQITKDDRLVVYHDVTLERLCGDPRRVIDLTYEELRTLDIGGGHRIPLFEDVLECVDGRAPLLVELKDCKKRNAELCKRTMALLREYRGSYIMESFNPLILRWLRKNDPDVIRGQLVGCHKSYLEYMGTWLAWVLCSMSLNFLARPDFVAYDVSARYHSPKVQRRLFRIPMAAWTVRDNETYENCVNRGEMPIFEGFIPDPQRT